MTIVRSIAEAHGGTVRLLDGAEGIGLRAAIDVAAPAPAADEGGAA